MDDQDSSSSTGLIIGLIIGGIVVLLLIAVTVFGAAFFFLAAPAPVAAPPVAVAVADPAPPAGGKVPVLEEAPPFPDPKRVAAEEKKAEGTWIATFPDGRTETWDMRADKTMEITTQRKGLAAAQTEGTWELNVEIGGPGVAIIHVTDKGEKTRRSIRYLDENRFVIEPSVVVEVDGVPAKGPDDGVIFERRGK
jgi:hypothetical protein